MRLIKLIAYLVAVLVLQTVVFTRLNLFGVFPDLVLVSVILFAVLEENIPTGIIFSSAAGFLQDVISTGGYFNLFSKTIVNAAVNTIRTNFSGDESALIYGLVAGMGPLNILAEEIWICFSAGSFHAPWLVLFKAITAVLYNLIITPVLLAIIKRVVYENQ